MTAGNDSIISLALAQHEACDTAEGSPQRQRLERMRKGVAAADLALVDEVCILLFGEALPFGTANADRLREIAREMCDPITNTMDGSGWRRQTRAAAFKRVRC